VSLEERALLLTPRGRDAAVAAEVLRAAGLEASPCADLPTLVAGLDQGAGLAVAAEEALRAADLTSLAAWLDHQPPWCDFPFVLLTQRTPMPEGGAAQSDLLQRLGNVIVLERPFHPHALVGVVRNVLRGRRRQYQARAYLDALREGEQRLVTALKAGRMGAWELDLLTWTLSASDQFKANFGRRADLPFCYEEMLGCIHPQDRPRRREALDHSIATGDDYAMDYRVLWPDGGQHWVEVRARVLHDAGGMPIRMVGVSADITPRKRAEAERERLVQALAVERERTQDALRGERAFTGLLLTSVPAGIVAYDPELRVTTWNPVMERLFGRRGPEVVGRGLLEVLAGVQGSAIQVRMRDALAGHLGPIEEIELPLGTTGKSWFCETQHAPLAGGDGRIVGGVAFFRDTTERRRAEEQLRQAQKMETIGQLTGGVAHDFNNLLMAVLGNLDLLRKRLPADTRLQRYVEGATQGAQRGAALTQRLLAFARRQDLRTEPVDLGRLVEGMDALMKRSLGPLVTIETRLGPALPPAMADANQLELALLNLAVNARDAMPGGGRLTITLDDPEPDPALALAPGSYLRLCVEDTGSGMDEATLRLAIEPFFSTKQLGKGTGLGLSMVHGLAVQLGGVLKLSSRLGLGTSAELWLPVASAPPRQDTVAAAPVTGMAPATILVVDDDVLIAMSTADMLKDLGHTVIEANSGAEALAILADGQAIDALVTDHAMPAMTGVELAERARALRPGLPVLLATGYADLPAGVATDLPRLGKPYRQRDLAEHLSPLLERRAGAGP